MVQLAPIIIIISQHIFLGRISLDAVEDEMKTRVIFLRVKSMRMRRTINGSVSIFTKVMEGTIEGTFYSLVEKLKGFQKVESGIKSVVQPFKKVGPLPILCRFTR